VADGVDAAINRVQPTPSDLAVNPRSRDLKREKLPSGHNAVLELCKVCDHLIDVSGAHFSIPRKEK
jgi:hypothetical protein